MDKQIVRFEMYEMEYKGGAVQSNLSLIPFEEKYYEQYRKLIDDCFYEMRKALNIQPYEKFCASLEDVVNKRKTFFCFWRTMKLFAAFRALKMKLEAWL